MNEDFLAYLWTFGLFSGPLLLTDGRPFSIETPGIQNHDSGPDFLGARVRIDGTLWVGNVEIHVKSSDWFLHQHQHDKNFETVILHVVFQHNRDVLLNGNFTLPVLELKDKLDPSLYTRYLQFMASSQAIPCEPLLSLNKIPVPNQWIISLGIHRLRRKADELSILISKLQSNWLELLFVSFCRSFGGKVNDDIFEMLALATPSRLIRKYGMDRLKTEALLFGQAGFLTGASDNFKDPYVLELKEAYAAIQYQHHCIPMESWHWKFLRTRPANFPTIRIAQLATLAFGFISINPLDFNELKLWMKEAVHLEVSAYWQNHCHFGKKCNGLPASIGKESIERIVINGLVNTLIRYGNDHKDHSFISSLIDLISELKPEHHRVSRQWEQMGFIASNALESQGLLELFNEYCRGKRCLECHFGHRLLASATAL
jgi:hypothetical protein